MCLVRVVAQLAQAAVGAVVAVVVGRRVVDISNHQYETRNLKNDA